NLVSLPSPSWPGASALVTESYVSIRDVVAPVPVSCRAISSGATGICQPACFGVCLDEGIHYVYAALARACYVLWNVHRRRAQRSGHSRARGNPGGPPALDPGVRRDDVASLHP